jgi:hypothetical protein
MREEENREKYNVFSTITTLPTLNPERFVFLVTTARDTEFLNAHLHGIGSQSKCHTSVSSKRYNQ